MPDDQHDVIAFLKEPRSYGAGVDSVERHETHISLVFLAGDRAYKLKRAVKYPYLDFSTAARRRQACAAELALNRRTAPELYLEVKTIGRGADGQIGWDHGEPLDHVVVMRRFEQGQVLDNIARTHGLDPALIYALAAHIAEFHAGADIRPAQGGAAAMAKVAADAITNCQDAGLDPGRIAAVKRAWQSELQRLAPLLDRRRDAGRVRRCHGDLHLRNICLLDSGPVLFDCLEFSEDLATIDVLYDLAFLLMDLIHRGHNDDASRLLNRYLDLTTEDDGLAAIPFFASLRATIRAHVAATAAQFADRETQIAEAHRYLDLAHTPLRHPPPVLIAVGGRSGSGKSSLAARLAAELGPVAGVRLLRSDVLRKHRFGITPETPLPESGYAPAVTEAVYAELAAKAAAALRAGCSAIIDAVSLAPEERATFAAIARQAAARFVGLWLEAPPAVMAARIAARRGDASDATTEILERQLRSNAGRLDWHRIDASGEVETTLSAARDALR